MQPQPMAIRFLCFGRPRKIQIDNFFACHLFFLWFNPLVVVVRALCFRLPVSGQFSANSLNSVFPSYSIDTVKHAFHIP
jgi:hypothetical protein